MPITAHLFSSREIALKVSRIVLLASISGAMMATCSGQGICTSNATTLPLVCALPITAAAVASGGGPTGAATAQVKNISNAINASIGTQLTQLPLPSATSGTLRILEKDNPAGVPYTNLGPILTDRPETVGRGHLYAGFTYQRFNFNAINGIPLGTVPFSYSFPSNATSTATTYGTQTSQIKFRFDQYVAQATIGVGKATDISVVLPINTVYVSVTNANIKSYNPIAGGYIPTSFSNLTVQGSASGVGDIQIGVKQQIHGSDGSPVAASLGLVARFPVGDYKNYLGSGAYGFNINGILSYRSKSRVSPHIRLGYQYNGPSPLVNALSTDGEQRLPGGLQYNVGADARIAKKLTFAIDLLGSEFANTTSLQPGVLSLTAGSSPVPDPLNTVTAFNNTYTTVNLSTGFKYQPVSHLIFYGNVLLQLNNVGIRSDPVPLGGIAYNFNLGRTR